ncbi:protein FAR-RED IMPAIRED RESPONSE 1-like [Lolium rigidum]|uniref:protein FAR-RED IMPAIRED RESPONSE 1-like n=1 Tax=Lolium rigidum TaxID=89674 RepID=UPI001F5DF749|nr:protein FAR-RED IMPAIRED RESPONSE 1-like [Lolium rigidum]
MTSTQRSESANHMLKTYVPPGSAMHVFVKQYNKLLYDRDSEESFQEKRTRLGGVVFKSGLPIEKHAAKIYTRTMFEKFQDFLYTAMSYDVDEIVTGEKFVARHVDSDTREKWCKVNFEVTMSDGYYSCECFMYEHMGMLCSHVLKVLVHLRMKEIPPKNILKRWTVDARDILPEHLKHYQKNNGLVKSFSYRHSHLYLNAMEMVRLGDTNVETYQAAIEMLKEGMPRLIALAAVGDGLGLEERMNAKKARTAVVGPALQNAKSTETGDGCTTISLDAALESKIFIRNSFCINVESITHINLDINIGIWAEVDTGLVHTYQLS